MSKHTALLDLPDFLRGLGLNVVVSDGWEEGQCKGNNHYLWTDPETKAPSHSNPPSGYMVHHAGSPSATIPPVRTSKAGAWIGLLRSDGKLHHQGGGKPTIALVSAGPARTSSGFGFPPAAWDHTFKDQRAPWRAGGPDDDDIALNRYTFNVETVHPGTGVEIDEGVWEHVVGLGIGLHQMFGWKERTLGHLSWTQRKPDPEWTVGLPNDGTKCIIDVQDAIAERIGGNGGQAAAKPTAAKVGQATTEGAGSQKGQAAMDGYFIARGQTDDRTRRRFWVERAQAKLAVLEGGDPELSNRRLIEGAGMNLGVNDESTQELLEKWGGATAVGPTEERRIEQKLAALTKTQ
jgi:hypothetical protein